MTATDLPARTDDQILQIDVERIRLHAKNLRADASDVDELTRSIASEGVIEPLIVAPHPDNTTDYLLIAGHRRLNAATRAGLPRVPCIIRYDLDDLESQIVTMLGENTQRANLTAVEEARGVQSLLDLGVTVARVAKRTGRKKDTVQKVAGLARTTPAMQDLVARERATLDDLALIEELAGNDSEVRGRLEQALNLSRHSFDNRVSQVRAEQVKAAKIAPFAEALRARGITVTDWNEIETTAETTMDRLLAAYDGADDPAWDRPQYGYLDMVFEWLDEEPDPITDEHRAIVDLDEDEPTTQWMRMRTDTEITTVPEGEHPAPAGRTLSPEAQAREAERQAQVKAAQARAEGLRAARLARAAHVRRRVMEGFLTARVLPWMRLAVLDQVPNYGDVSAYAVILGVDPAEHTEGPAVRYAAAPGLRGLDLPNLVALHRALGNVRWDQRLNHPAGWTTTDPGNRSGQAWFRELRDAWGYTPSEVEAELAAQMPAADDPDPDEAQ